MLVEFVSSLCITSFRSSFCASDEPGFERVKYGKSRLYIPGFVLRLGVEGFADDGQLPQPQGHTPAPLQKNSSHRMS